MRAGQLYEPRESYLINGRAPTGSLNRLKDRRTMRVSWQACDELASDVVPAADLSFTYWRQSFDVPIDPRAPECHPYRRTANAGAFDDLWIEKNSSCHRETCDALYHYPHRLCRLAWVGCSSLSVCLFVCLSAA